MSDQSTAIFGFGFFVLIGSCLIFLCMWGCPHYSVYYSRMDGQAKLAHAQSEREVQVKDAQGKMEAASLLAQAEIERAKGVAQANQIIGDSLKNNEAYLRYLWIHNLEAGNNSVVYVPTEANLPILEAGKRK